MDLKTLKDLPPWDWPEDTDKMLLDILLDEQADASDRLLAQGVGRPRQMGAQANPRHGGALSQTETHAAESPDLGPRRSRRLHR